MADESFENLALPKKDLPESPVGRYRVYKDATNFINVAADTAMQAIDACGFKDIYKIERDRLDAHNLLSIDEWKALQAQSASKIATPGAEPAQPAATVATSSE